jgi:predicted neuraminidase
MQTSKAACVTPDSSLKIDVTQQKSSVNSKLTRRSLLTAAVCGWGYWSTCSTAPAAQRNFLLPTSSDLSSQSSIFESRMIEHSEPMGFAHCASICESSSGELTCVWYAGSREGARDVNIWLSQLDRSQQQIPVSASLATGAEPLKPLDRLNGNSSQPLSSWSTPRSIMDCDLAQASLNQYVKKVGNAIAFFDQSDRLWMIYVSIAMGGWSTSSLNATYSDDGGKTWSAGQRLWLSPSLNISELVRCPPVHMTNGEIGIPIYHECAGVFPEMLWLDPSKAPIAYNKTRLCGGRDWLQPSVVPTGAESAICYLRCANEFRRVGYQVTYDAGESWSAPALSELPNPNSAVCGVQLSNSSILLALNYSKDKRESLSLAYSPDGISNWHIVATIDQELGERFSYPSLIRGRDGLIHLVYSWKMQKIRHVCFNDNWVFSQLGQVRSPSTVHPLDSIGNRT